MGIGPGALAGLVTAAPAVKKGPVEVRRLS